MKTSYDAIVIGSGQAGPPLAVRLAEAGQKTALIEGEHLGGTCVNDGCIPTKTLVATARVAHVARRADDFGVRVGGPVSVDMKAVKARKDRVVAHSVDALSRMDRRHRRAHPRLGPCALRRAARGRGERPDARGGKDLHQRRWPGGAAPLARHRRRAGAHQHLDDGARHPARAPGHRRRQLHRARVRADVPALRLARHGGRVRRPADRPRGPRGLGRGAADPRGRGHRLPLLGASRRGARRCRRPAACTSSLDAAGTARELEASHLLAAVGRRPNTDDLGLDQAGIAVDERGYITVDDELRTRVPGVWALGDVNGRGAFTHTSYNDYQIVADNLLDGAHAARQRSHPDLRPLHRSAARPGRPERGARCGRAASRRWSASCP